MKTYPQGSLLFPKATFAFRGASGRLSRAIPGQSFWVVSTQQEQTRTGNVRVARSGKSAGYAETFTAADVANNFSDSSK